MEDHTTQMDLVAFGRLVEKLISATIAKLVALQTINHMTLLGPVRTLVKQIRVFTVGLTTKAIQIGIANYKMFDSDEHPVLKWHASNFAGALASPTPTLTIQLEEQALPSPIKS